MKTCTCCGQTKPLDEFYNDSRATSGKYCHCKTCRQQYKLFKRRQSPESLDVDVNHNKQVYLSKRYAISQNDLMRLLELANHCCQICGKKPKLMVDHDHKTGNVRGILCNRCNTAIGMLDDNILSLTKAISYLQKASTTVNILQMLNSMTGRNGI